MKRTLFLLSPLIIGFLVTVFMGLAGGFFDPDFLGGLWLIAYVFSASIFILFSYGAVLVYNVARFMARKSSTRSKLGLVAPILFGIVLTLLVGFFPSPLQRDSNGEEYFVFYGFPASWRWLPTPSCPENAVLYYFSDLPPLRCQPGFHTIFLAYDILIYTGLLLWLNYILVLVVNTLPAFKNMWWPIFLPKVLVETKLGPRHPSQP